MKSKSKVLIAPSILSADFANLAAEVQAVERAGADWVHVDVMDGHFVPNLTIGPVVVKSLRRRTKLPLDVHLMIENPEKYLPDFAKAGSTLTTVHWEACHHPQAVLKQMRKLGLKTGMSIKPKTPLDVLLPYVKDLDLALIMSVEPGFGGQSFMEDMMEKVRDLKGFILRKGYRCLVEVDGGINAVTASQAVRAGADVLVAGHAIFGSGRIGPDFRRLRASVDKSLRIR